MKKLIIIAAIIAAVVGIYLFSRKYHLFLGKIERDENGRVSGVKINTQKWVDRQEERNGRITAKLEGGNSDFEY